MTQHRACFDFRITFTHGGTLTRSGFRLDLPVTGFRFRAAPPRIERFGTFPVRAYAVIE